MDDLGNRRTQREGKNAFENRGGGHDDGCRLAGLILIETRANQLTVLVPDRFIAFAGSVSQTLDIDDVYISARIFDHAGSLKGMRNGGDARSTHAEHFCQELLGEREIVTSGQIPRAKQPPA